MLHTVREVVRGKPAPTLHLAVHGPVTLCGVKLDVVNAHRAPAPLDARGRLAVPEESELCGKCRTKASKLDGRAHDLPDFGRHLRVTASGD